MVKSGQYGYRRPAHTEMVCWINRVESRGGLIMRRGLTKTVIGY